MRRANLLDLPFLVGDLDEALAYVERAVEADERATVAVAAVHATMQRREDPALAVALADANLVVPDGQPLVWGLRLLGEPAHRVYGPDLMLAACRRAAARGWDVYLYGGADEGALADLLDRLETLAPGLRVVGAESPPHRTLSDAELDAVAARIDASGADVVWVGLGCPKQEIWMHRMRERTTTSVLVGVGAAFDFHAGRVRQAPAWLGRIGLEWLFRLSQDPRRLWRRYARHNPRFLILLALAVVRHRRD